MRFCISPVGDYSSFFHPGCPPALNGDSSYFLTSDHEVFYQMQAGVNKLVEIYQQKEIVPLILAAMGCAHVAMSPMYHSCG
jgi:hypothetical protein